SRCPLCHVACPGQVWLIGNAPARVFLRRLCPEHGETSVCIASDARFYWLAQGKLENAACLGQRGSAGANSGAFPKQACCAGSGSPAGMLGRNAAGRGDGPFEQLSTCLALIEIVQSCNLSCPTCYADSPIGSANHVTAVPLDQLKARIQSVVDRKGGIEI